jgi:hypothetical protein
MPDQFLECAGQLLGFADVSHMDLYSELPSSLLGSTNDRRGCRIRQFASTPILSAVGRISRIIWIRFPINSGANCP